MRRFVFGFLFIVAVVSGWAYSASALTPEISAQFRARTEADLHRGLPLASANDDTLNIRSFLRTRINLKLVKDSTTSLFVQMQDSRVYGGARGTSGGLANDMNLGIHQAYLEFRHWIWYRLEGRVGRQELIYGNHRLIGSVGWSNVGRSYDGAKAAINFNQGKVKLEGGLYTMVERDNFVAPTQGKNQDNLLTTLALLFPKSNIEIMLIGDADMTRTSVSNRAMQRGTLSLYSARKFGGAFDYITNLAWQGGTWDPDSTFERDIEAYLLTLELGATVPGAAKARFALGIDHASGDDGADSTKAKEFVNLYYTGHKFRGFIDNFLRPFGTVAAQGPGLTDLYGRAHFNFHPKWRIGVDGHLFQTAQDYVSLNDASATKSVGTELDAWIKLSNHNGIDFMYGLALFSASQDWTGPNHERSQLWSFAQIMVDFK
jgi:hypothetical protein